jgi:hypothetical protein
VATRRLKPDPGTPRPVVQSRGAVARALALALAIVAARCRNLGRVPDVTESTAMPLVRAVSLIDEESGPAVHRGAALIEVGVAAQALGFREWRSSTTTDRRRCCPAPTIRVWPRPLLMPRLLGMRHTCRVAGVRRRVGPAPLEGPARPDDGSARSDLDRASTPRPRAGTPAGHGGRADRFGEPARLPGLSQRADGARGRRRPTPS